jgi:hypothetical protein
MSFSFPYFYVRCEPQAFVVNRKNGTVCPSLYSTYFLTSNVASRGIPNTHAFASNQGKTDIHDKTFESAMFLHAQGHFADVEINVVNIRGDKRIFPVLDVFGIFPAYSPRSVLWTYRAISDTRAILANVGQDIAFENGRIISEKTCKDVPETFFGTAPRASSLLASLFYKQTVGELWAYDYTDPKNAVKNNEEDDARKKIYLDCNVALTFPWSEKIKEFSDTDVKKLIKFLDIFVALPSALIVPRSMYVSRRATGRAAGHALFSTTTREMTIVYRSLSPWFARSRALFGHTLASLFMATRVFFNKDISEPILEAFSDEVLLAAINSLDEDAMYECERLLLIALSKVPAWLRSEPLSIFNNTTLTSIIWAHRNRKEIHKILPSKGGGDTQTMLCSIFTHHPQMAADYQKFIDSIKESPDNIFNKGQ